MSTPPSFDINLNLTDIAADLMNIVGSYCPPLFSLSSAATKLAFNSTPAVASASTSVFGLPCLVLVPLGLSKLAVNAKATANASSAADRVRSLFHSVHGTGIAAAGVAIGAVSAHRVASALGASSTLAGSIAAPISLAASLMLRVKGPLIVESIWNKYQLDQQLSETAKSPTRDNLADLISKLEPSNSREDRLAVSYMKQLVRTLDANKEINVERVSRYIQTLQSDLRYSAGKDLVELGANAAAIGGFLASGSIQQGLSIFTAAAYLTLAIA